MKMIQFFPGPQAGENEIAIGTMVAPLFFLPGRQFTLPWKPQSEIGPRPACTANSGLRNATQKFHHARKNYIFPADKWPYKTRNFVKILYVTISGPFRIW
jgi:hypothetical protein